LFSFFAVVCSHSRLIEITGQWSELTEKIQELHSLFTTFDTKSCGRVELKDLECCLSALRMSVPSSKLAELFAVRDDAKDGAISRDEFVSLMNATKLTMFQAVKFDVEEGLRM
jgi:Ca2+-binding EF-hand superfamily protein